MGKLKKYPERRPCVSTRKPVVPRVNTWDTPEVVKPQPGPGTNSLVGNMTPRAKAPERLRVPTPTIQEKSPGGRQLIPSAANEGVILKSSPKRLTIRERADIIRASRGAL